MSVAKLIVAAAAASTLIGAPALAAEAVDTPAAAAKPAKAKQAPPIGGYLPQPPNSQHLRELKWAPSEGYPLYVMNRECRSQCAVTFPPLTPGSADAKPPSKAWSVRVRDENGALQWVYKGRPVYTYTDDKPGEPPKADKIVPGVELARK